MFIISSQYVKQKSMKIWSPISMKYNVYNT